MARVRTGQKAFSRSRAHPVAADLRDDASVRSALAGVDPTHVFFCTWLRQPSEAENVRVNGGMMRHLFAALEAGKHLTHVALVTGTKQYLGPLRPTVKPRPKPLSRRQSPAARLELLLHPGRHPLRCGAAWWIQLERASAAQHRWIRSRERYEHGRHAGCLCEQSAATPDSPSSSLAPICSGTRLPI